MRYVWLIFAGLVAAMAFILPRLNRQPAPAGLVAAKGAKSTPTTLAASFAALRTVPTASMAARADSIVAFGLAQRGIPYVYAGTTPLTGFDCSGFIMYTFAHFGVAVPHSTALLIDVGRPVPRAEAQPGDIVVFTGTADPSSEPGHAGIVISRRGELPLRFVHASSARRESGVKVSQVEGTDYERRFMQVRRVLGPGEVAAARPKTVIPARTAAPVAALPTRSIAVEPEALPAAPLPQRLEPKKPLAHTAPEKHTVARKYVATKKKAAAKKAAPKKSVATKKAATKTAPVKKPVVKKKTAATKAKSPSRTTAR
ncbi:MAG: hypothetical protein JWR44_3656 [Hymenobacter sp.]|jgi:cell wall-associated NlpC family hydrolase|nr:hypothetical protein [Hymenobacter sp.]